MPQLGIEVKGHSFVNYLAYDLDDLDAPPKLLHGRAGRCLESSGSDTLRN